MTDDMVVGIFLLGGMLCALFYFIGLWAGYETAYRDYEESLTIVKNSLKKNKEENETKK